MRYEVLEKFFADTRLHLNLVEVSEQSVERPLREVIESRGRLAGTGRPGQRNHSQPGSRPLHQVK